ncbi:MAG: CarD family transcriptional regulator [Sphaerochaetaceae bacterium]
MSSEQKLVEFSVGEHIVYPLQGVGIVKQIEERTFKGIPTKYYVIYLNSSDMTVMVPVDKSKEIGVRAIVPAEEAQDAINSISDKYEQLPIDWKDRYKMNVDLLRQGSIASFARVVQSLYHRSKIKELPVQERKLYDNALNLLIDESSFALKKDPLEIKKMVFSKLEK